MKIGDRLKLTQIAAVTLGKEEANKVVEKTIETIGFPYEDCFTFKGGKLSYRKGESHIHGNIIYSVAGGGKRRTYKIVDNQ